MLGVMRLYLACKSKMPYKYLPRLRGSFSQGIHKTNITLEGTLDGSFEVLLGHGKILFGNPRFYSVPFLEPNDLNTLL